MAKTEIVKLRVTPAEKTALCSEAKAAGAGSVSEYVRGKVVPNVLDVGNVASPVPAGESLPSGPDREEWVAAEAVRLRRVLPTSTARREAEKNWTMLYGEAA